MTAVAEAPLKYRNALSTDIDGVLALHRRYQIDTIAEEDKADGFVTTPFTAQQMERLIADEAGLFVAHRDGEIVAYIMAASWDFWSAWPMFVHMIRDLGEITYRGYRLSTENSYQYGPVCVDKSVRGRGVLEDLYHFARRAMASRYPVLVTFIHTANPRSFAAHTRKLGLDVVREFSYNGKDYWELADLTADESM